MVRKILFIFFTLYTNLLFAQVDIFDGLPMDSTYYAFNEGDSLRRIVTHRHIEIDTSGCLLWQIGTTGKTFFTSGGTVNGAIMTDTVNPYPINSDDWFLLKLMTYNSNVIISFFHKYQTTAGHDGGIVEFSSDSGVTWNNVMDSCNISNGSLGGGGGIITSNFYDKDDTLLAGEWAFSGASNGFQYSRLQFFHGLPVKTTSGVNCTPNDTIFVRFRFKSDDTLETLDGWIIDSLKIEYDQYWGGIHDIKGNRLSVYPNPSYDGIVHFPSLPDERNYRIEIINTIGVKILSVPYLKELDLRRQPKGTYFYRVTNDKQYYTGHLLIE